MNCCSLADGVENFEIACEFDDLPDALVLDDSVETTLAGEYLTNASGRLEVAKSYKVSSGKLERTAIRCMHPADQALSGLLALEMADLKKLGDERGVSADVPDQRVASHWRNAIRMAAGQIAVHETLLDVDKGLSSESKSIWCQSARNVDPLSASNIYPLIDDQRLACPALAGVAEGRPSAGDGYLRL